MDSPENAPEGNRRELAAHILLSAARYGVPELPSPHVRRPRLLSALAAAEQRPLVLVSAPAGTGKTALVAEWARQHVLSSPTGWVTFEDGDRALWPDLVACLGRLGVSVPAASWRTPDGRGVPRPQLTALAEAVAEAPRRLTVVLDGYELVERAEARDLHFLLQHTWGRLCLVLVGRVDPVLPLYRYRLADTLAEVRGADLAFTDAEAATLLGGSGAALGPAAVHDLNARVGGWAAGLRFSARALAAGDGTTSSVTDVLEQTGDINEYLLGEVLDVQPADVRRFLLETSVADVLSPGLVEQLGGPAALHTLHELSRLNIFVEPVPGQPGSWRYYPFFKDLLQAQLAYEQPDRLVELHRRAAQWFQGEGLLERSVGHLVAISAWDEVASQLAGSDEVARLLVEGASAGVLWSTATRLPEDLELAAACVVRSAVALATGDTARCVEELTRARAARLEDQSADDGVAAALIEAVRGSHTDSAEQAVRLADRAEQCVRARHGAGHPPGTESLRVAWRCKGVAALRCGDLTQARASLMAVVRAAPEQTSPSLRADALGHLAVVDALEGHLAEASRRADECLAVTAHQRPSAVGHAGTAAHLALALVAVGQCDTRGARHHVAVVTSSPAMHAHSACRSLAQTVLAGIERSRGDLPSALARLSGEAATASSRGDIWLADHLRVEAAKLGIASGRPEVALTALGSVEQQDGPEAAAVAAAAHAERGQSAAAASRLDQVRHHKAPLQTEVLGLLAEGIHEARQQSPSRARVALDRSLRLAAPEGLRRPFKEGGPLVQRLLASDPALLLNHQWLTHPESHPARQDRPPRTHREPAEPVEDLTAKELEVLSRLEELLTTEEIAEKLFISVNTVRTHVRNILRKLDVNRRNAAVRRARELGLLSE